MDEDQLIELGAILPKGEGLGYSRFARSVEKLMETS